MIVTIVLVILPRLQGARRGRRCLRCPSQWSRRVWESRLRRWCTRARVRKSTRDLSPIVKLRVMPGEKNKAVPPPAAGKPHQARLMAGVSRRPLRRPMAVMSAQLYVSICDSGWSF